VARQGCDSEVRTQGVEARAQQRSLPVARRHGHGDVAVALVGEAGAGDRDAGHGVVASGARAAATGRGAASAMADNAAETLRGEKRRRWGVGDFLGKKSRASVARWDDHVECLRAGRASYAPRGGERTWGARAAAASARHARAWDGLHGMRRLRACARMRLSRGMATTGRGARGGLATRPDGLARVQASAGQLG
jgi:hypothetical protein